jgi:uncharacterized protein (TIGR02453 family)
MRFGGWPPTAIAWFEGLELDNSKAYWTAHRHIYDEDVRGPMEALLDDLAPEFGEGKVFRPYRDVRFSADKSPYKTSCYAVASPDERTGFYVGISADGLSAASGFYRLDRDQLERYRAAVADDGPGTEAEKVVEALEHQGYEIAGEALKSAPRGYPKDHPRIRLLRHKSLYAWRMQPPGGLMHAPEAREWIAETWRGIAPLNDWLLTYVGGSAETAETS